jgi:hypothetical protein
LTHGATLTKNIARTARLCQWGLQKKF